MAAGSYTVAAFYKFVAIPDVPDLRRRLAARCCGGGGGMCGTILIAGEGINGTIAAEDGALRGFLEFLRGDPRFGDLEVKFSTAPERPFKRMKVRIKHEIAALGVPGTDPNAICGTYVEPEAWNTLIAEPDVVVIDTRNVYECEIGTFEGAIDPGMRSFGEFPAWVDRNRARLAGKKLAMFCTGGIRCEKATAYVKGLGYSDVYHLKGGILRYLEVMPMAESRWRGACYVFDERVAVTHGVDVGTFFACAACGLPVREGGRCEHPERHKYRGVA